MVGWGVSLTYWQQSPVGNINHALDQTSLGEGVRYDLYFANITCVPLNKRYSPTDVPQKRLASEAANTVHAMIISRFRYGVSASNAADV